MVSNGKSPNAEVNHLTHAAADEKRESGKQARPICGLIMPISAIDGCSADHWLEVKSIIQEAVGEIADPNFDVRLVSDADEIGVIQKRIVQTIYSAEIIVCDVSGKNPNVMFELGMRLAFDKPTVIIKDDKTEYSFDTSVIEHVSYPRDLRFNKIVSFKETLIRKIQATYRASLETPQTTTFLKSFGKFNVAKLDEQSTTAERFTVDALSDLQFRLDRVTNLVEQGIREREFVEPGTLRPRGLSGTARIRRVLEERMKTNPQTTVQQLLLEGYVDHVENEIKARNYFSTRDDFIRAYERVAKDVGVPF